MTITNSKTEWDAGTLRRLFESGIQWLERHATLVNMINVFPVPDGDTGTNVVLTATTGLRDKRIKQVQLSKFLTEFARGNLLGARGNAGVIAALFFQGMAQSVETNNYKVIDRTAIVSALKAASKKAYLGVISPLEGTILTAMTAAAKAAEIEATDTQDLEQILSAIVTNAHEATTKSANLINVLVETGYVDAGAVAIDLFLEGMLHYVRGTSIEEPPSVLSRRSWSYERLQHLKILDRQLLGLVGTGPITGTLANLVYGVLISPCGRAGIYVTSEEDRVWLRKTITFWSKLLFSEFGLYPFTPLGSVKGIIADSEKRLRQRSRVFRERFHLPQAQAHFDNRLSLPFEVIAICSADGFSRMFQLLGAKCQLPIHGLNLDTILSAIATLATENVVILANSSNTIPMLFEAKEIQKRQSRRRIHVVETRNEIQGIAAMVAADPTQTFETNIPLLVSGSDAVTTISTKYAHEKKGYVGLVDGVPQEGQYENSRSALLSSLRLSLTSGHQYIDVYGNTDVYEEAAGLFPKLEVNYFPDVGGSFIGIS